MNKEVAKLNTDMSALRKELNSIKSVKNDNLENIKADLEVQKIKVEYDTLRESNNLLHGTLSQREKIILGVFKFYEQYEKPIGNLVLNQHNLITKSDKIALKPFFTRPPLFSSLNIDHDYINNRK